MAKLIISWYAMVNSCFCVFPSSMHLLIIRLYYSQKIPWNRWHILQIKHHLSLTHSSTPKPINFSSTSHHSLANSPLPTCSRTPTPWSSSLRTVTTSAQLQTQGLGAYYIERSWRRQGVGRWCILRAWRIRLRIASCGWCQSPWGAWWRRSSREPGRKLEDLLNDE